MDFVGTLGFQLNQRFGWVRIYWAPSFCYCAVGSPFVIARSPDESGRRSNPGGVVVR